MNPQSGSWRDGLSPLVFLSNNWISRLGVILVTAGTIFWLFLLPTFVRGDAGSAYLGILMFLILPVVFFAGLALIPLGIGLRKRKLGPSAGIRDAMGASGLGWRNPHLQRLLAFVGGVTIVNVAIGASLTYRAVHHMESVQFCGATCHVVMKPEYTAYQNSPHSRVDCVQCHIGPGASWFVQSKISGVRQVFAVALNTYTRPIEVPIPNLRPARETCEGCHWPDKFGGDRLRVIPHYDDEGARTDSVLLMRIGGGSAGGYGIHSAHVGKGIRIRYAHSDRERQKIPWVEYSSSKGKNEFFAPDAKAEDVAKMDIREMDCMDCHTRPSHAMELPGRALDRAMAAGTLPPSLPQVRKAALAAMEVDYPTTEDAVAKIPAAVRAYYQEKLPEVATSRKADVELSAQTTLALWQRNVFPEMQVKWGTYINNIGHNDFPGCFRCHDEEHKTRDGAKAIGQDCNTCHVMLAMEESKPKILEDLGLAAQ